jgi:hypothetical protein
MQLNFFFIQPYSGSMSHNEMNLKNINIYKGIYSVFFTKEWHIT